MSVLMNRLYDNIDEAKAFQLSFTNFVYFYDSVSEMDFLEVLCEKCDNCIQVSDYLVPSSNCKKPCGILHSLEFGVNEELRNELIANFDIDEDDFRPIRNKKKEIVYYQIVPKHVMLPIHEKNGWRPKKPCPKCGSVRYKDNDFENEKGEPFYYISKEALDDMHDLNVTYERFDFHMPLFIISRRVYDFLVERYPRLHFFPLFLK